MTGGAGAGAQVPQRDARWKWLLLALCGVSFIATFAIAGSAFGVGGRPWFGWWDALHAPTGQPYVLGVTEVRLGGASAQAGLRAGDRIDLRDQPLAARIGIIFQPVATQTTTLRVTRGSRTLGIRIAPTTSGENEPFWKEPPLVVGVVANLWFLLCALIITLRRWWSGEARILALVLLCLTFAALNPAQIVTPNAVLNLTLFLLSSAAWLAVFGLLVVLSSRFGTVSRGRRVLEWLAFGMAFLVFLSDAATVTGLATLWIDPLPFAFVVSPLRGILDLIAAVVLVVTVSVAISKTLVQDRPRAAWLLLPLPLAFAGRDLAYMVASFVNTWFANDAVITIGLAFMLLGAFTVTYGLLRRRVLDFEFVLSRTLVVASVSLIIVASFALLEWLLGTVLAGVSHATGLIANGALALGLGLSLNPIHKRVDGLVDAVLFRQRHEDEQALRDFSKEAAYVTESEALLDQTIAKVQRHTDARSAALLLDGKGSYEAVRSFGDGALREVGENDEAVLALKAWHKPVDPHHYATALLGALALPMLVRGRLLGVLVMGERAGGEAYAPDDVEALSQIAHGVGTAIDGLMLGRGEAQTRIADTQEKILDELRRLPSKLAEVIAREDAP